MWCGHPSSSRCPVFAGGPQWPDSAGPPSGVPCGLSTGVAQGCPADGQVGRMSLCFSCVRPRLALQAAEQSACVWLFVQPYGIEVHPPRVSWELCTGLRPASRVAPIPVWPMERCRRPLSGVVSPPHPHPTLQQWVEAPSASDPWSWVLTSIFSSVLESGFSLGRYPWGVRLFFPRGHFLFGFLEPCAGLAVACVITLSSECLPWDAPCLTWSFSVLLRSRHPAERPGGHSA